MFYERKGDAIITSAIDINCDAATFYEVDGMLSDDGYTYDEASIRGVENRWNSEQASRIINSYDCGVFNNEIVCRIWDSNLDIAVMRMVQAITAVETYLYHMQKKTEG